MRSLKIVLLILAVAWITPNSAATVEGTPLRAAVFVRNRAGEEFREKVAVLDDVLTARLTEKGFSIIDREDVLVEFEEAHENDPPLFKTLKELTGDGTGRKIEDSLKDSSALRLAQMVGADYLIVATIDSFGKETKRFKGKGTIYGVDNVSTVYTLRLTLKVLEASRGGSVYGDAVKASESIPGLDNLEIESTEVINSLFDVASAKIAQRVGQDVEEIRAAEVKQLPAVEFIISTNGIEGATVELDGTAIGTVGAVPTKFAAAPGVHMMRITRPWFTPWEKPINIYADQNLNVSLELSDAGIHRFKDIEGFKMEMAARQAEIDIAQEQSDADAYAKKLLAEGEKKRLEESYERIDTSNVERLSVGDREPTHRVIVEEDE